MSDTKITFHAAPTPPLAKCGCKLIGSTAVVLCSLHAAAPDLLAACEQLASCHGHPVFVGSVFFEVARDMARAAIAKAKGDQK